MRGLMRLAGLAGFAAATTLGGRAAVAAGTVKIVVPTDYPTIQAALDAAPKDQIVQIDVRKGTYDETLIARGFGNLTLRADPGTRVRSASSEAALTVCTCYRAEVSGLTLEAAGPGVYVRSVDRLILKGLTVPHPGGDGILVDSPRGVASVAFNPPHMSEGQGLREFTLSIVYIDTTTVDSAAGDALRVGSNSWVTMTSSKLLSSAGDGVHADGRNAAPGDLGFVSIQKTEISGCGDDGVDVTELSLYLGESVVRSCPGDGVSKTGTGDVTVESTTVEHCAGDGFRIESGSARFLDSTAYVSGGRGFAVTDATVTFGRCHASFCGDDGFQLTGAARASIVTATVESCHGDGVDAGAAFVDCRDAVVVGCSGDGVRLGVAGSSLAEVTVERCDSGIVTAEGGECGRIEDCRVVSTTGDGIRVSALAVAKNTVERAGGRGIAVSRAPSAAETGPGVSQNTVRTAKSDGIFTDAFQARVLENVVDGAGASGILAQAQSVVVQQNKVSDTAGAGIVVLGDDSRVVWNLVNATRGDGIDAAGARVVADGNEVSDSALAGVRIAGAGAVAERNEIRDVAGHGLVLGEGWGYVYGQWVVRAGGDGICIESTAGDPYATVESNTVEQCAGDGIDLGPARGVMVKANRVREAGDCAFRLGALAAKNHFVRNKARRSGKFDLWEDDGARGNRFDRSNHLLRRRLAQ